MFPYNDDENAWISKAPQANYAKENLLLTVIFAISSAVFASTIPPMIYFFKYNLI